MLVFFDWFFVFLHLPTKVSYRSWTYCDIINWLGMDLTNVFSVIIEVFETWKVTGGSYWTRSLVAICQSHMSHYYLIAL